MAAFADGSTLVNPLLFSLQLGAPRSCVGAYITLVYSEGQSQDLINQDSCLPGKQPQSKNLRFDCSRSIKEVQYVWMDLQTCWIDPLRCQTQQQLPRLCSQSDGSFKGKQLCDGTLAINHDHVPPTTIALGSIWVWIRHLARQSRASSQNTCYNV